MARCSAAARGRRAEMAAAAAADVARNGAGDRRNASFATNMTRGGGSGEEIGAAAWKNGERKMIADGWRGYSRARQAVDRGISGNFVKITYFRIS